MSPAPHHVLIAGGGVAAIEAALALREHAADRVRVTMLAPEPRFWYRPLAVAEPFQLGKVTSFELAQLATQAGATFLPGTLVSVDTDRRIARTGPGGLLDYSTLLIACGARPRRALEGAITFRGPADGDRIAQLLAELERGDVRSVAFVVPIGATWTLPVYELALLTSAWLVEKGETDVEVSVVTPERRPLHLFGREASDAVGQLLEERGIALHTRACPAEARDGALHLIGSEPIEAERVVALARLEGQRIGGIPQTYEGFVPVDAHGQVHGAEHVYAAGDITDFAVKQGGIAAQQADAAAEAIAADVGALDFPHPFRPVLRGVLLTGDGPQYLRGPLEVSAESVTSTEPLWWPPAKIVGRYLAPFLADLSGDVESAQWAPGAGVSVEVAFDAEVGAASGSESGRTGPSLSEELAAQRRERLIEDAVSDALSGRELARVDDVMCPDPLIVSPEDTLGEIAERMAVLDVGSALVVEYGRLIGILTSRDMLRAVAGRVHSSEARARQWMTADPVTATSGTALEVARLVMTEHGFHHLPVVEGDHPVGLVGLREVVRDGSPLQIGLGLGF